MKKDILFNTAATFTNSLKAQEKLEADIPHCRVEFSVSFLTFAKQTGVFPDISISFDQINPDFSDSKVLFTADVKTLNMNHPERNDHLQSENFFNSTKYPFIKFENKSFDKVDINRFLMIGDLTIKGVTLSSAFNVTWAGETTDPITKEHLYIFNLNGTFKRLDFGVGTDFPELAIGNDINLDASIVLKKLN
ncbi:YceI family protein [Sphingobacterium faecium]|uniref:YceI family protein n=1 Tax=Sphingobacterium faecium TaxID=34087 RepID=UPI003208ADC0